MLRFLACFSHVTNEVDHLCIFALFFFCLMCSIVSKIALRVFGRFSIRQLVLFFSLVPEILYKGYMCGQ